MEYLIKLKLDVLAPDEMLKEHELTYISVGRVISLKFIPFPGMWVHINPIIDDKNRERYSSLFQKVSHKPGLFEVDRCIAHVDHNGDYDLSVILKPKMETTYESFQAMKEYIEYFGFKNNLST
ncbi:hypothetical protein [Zooshikella sp. RANM57]|uniref:hypothetical protein n=1 Tax=Zooshikella sp. RANM57 TaxID=3425863 RepID=UPI003D6E6484